LASPRFHAALRMPTKYAKDVEYCSTSCEQEARDLLVAKKIDWKEVRKEFEKLVARDVKDDVGHVKLCGRMIARLQDGHRRTSPQVNVQMPDGAAGVRRRTCSRSSAGA
jgi:hypothetical protein